MNLTRCKIGHFYDADKHSECPHCDKGDDNSEQTSFDKEPVLAGIPLYSFECETQENFICEDPVADRFVQEVFKET